MSLVGQVFVFFCTPQASVERELQGKLSAKPGRVVSPAFLGELRAAYEKACDTYKDDFDIATLETDGVDQRAVAYAVAVRIFGAIESRKPS